MSSKSPQQFRRIIGQKRMTALSHFTKIGKPVPGEKRAVFLARMREEWGRLGDLEKKAFKKDAVVNKQQPPQTEPEKTAYLRRVCSELNELTDFMKQLGWSFFYKITTETSTLESPESPAAALNPTPIPPTKEEERANLRQEVQNLFNEFCGQATIMRGNFPTPIPPTPTPRPPKGEKDEERANLRREVQNLFNKLYGQATGRRGNFPYKRHHIMPELTVTGLPNGVPFKEPYSYGLPALKAILAQKSQIKMHMIQASLSENAAPVTPGEDTTAAVSAEEAFLKQEQSVDEEVPLKQEYSIAEELPLKQERSIAEGVLLKWEHVKAEGVLLKEEHSIAEEVLKQEHSIPEEVPWNTGTCYSGQKRARVADQHYGPYPTRAKISKASTSGLKQKAARIFC